MVLYWHLPLFAAMSAVTKVVNMLKENVTIQQMSEELFTYKEYEGVLKMSMKPISLQRQAFLQQPSYAWDYPS